MWILIDIFSVGSYTLLISVGGRDFERGGVSFMSMVAYGVVKGGVFNRGILVGAPIGSPCFPFLFLPAVETEIRMWSLKKGRRIEEIGRDLF